MTTITSVDRAATAYMCCLVDCVVELWKRVYNYAYALFAGLFGDTPNQTCGLPPSLVGIVADYAFDFRNHREFLYIEREVYECYSNYKVKFEVKNLTRELAALLYLWEAFPHPSLLKKIETLFLTTYHTSSGAYDHVYDINVRRFYLSLNLQISDQQMAQFFVRNHKMNQNEAEQAVELWKGFKKIECLKQALLVLDSEDKSLCLFEKVLQDAVEVVRINKY